MSVKIVSDFQQFICYLLALMFFNSILCFLAFEFSKKHQLLACAMDDVMNKVLVYKVI